MSLNNCLVEIGMNVEAVLARFGNNMMILEKVLRKFPADQSFDKLQAALKDDNMQEAEVGAHTLKGLTGNLGLDRLFELSQKLLDAIRLNNIEVIKPYNDLLIVEYYRVIEILNKHLI